MAGAVGNFGFPGQDIDSYQAVSFASPFAVSTKQSRDPKIAYFNIATSTPAAGNSAPFSFFRVTLSVPIKIFSVSIHAYKLSSAGAFQILDNVVANMVTLAGATWPSVSQMPGTYGTNGFNNTTVTWSYSPQYGPFIWTGPMYVSPGIQWQLSCTAYASFSGTDTLQAGCTILWDTM